MPDKETYARRSDLHKKTTETAKEEDKNILDDNQPKTEVHSDKSNSLTSKRKNPYGKYIFGLVALLIIVIIATAGYIAYTLQQQEKEAQEKYEAAASALLDKVAEEQAQNGLETESQLLAKGDRKEVIYRPQDDSKMPISDATSKLTALVEKLDKKHSEKEIVTIAQVKSQAVSSKVSVYSLQADSYVWNRESGKFKDADTLTESPVYVSEKTKTALTIKDLIPDQASLLGIQQVIEQKILEQSDDPDKIIDAVLTMDKITFDSKMTYDPEKLTIELPENKTGVDKITLAYKDIAAFIDTDLVKAESVKDALPVLDENKKYIALTFDDGPNDSSTLNLLDILKENDVKATFFMLGQMVAQYPDSAKKVAEAGHEIASHSYSHPQLNTLSADDLREEIIKTDEAIFKATGTLPRNLRPPYGAIDKKSAETVAMPIIQWDIDSQDWKSKDPGKINAVVKQNAFNGAIILIHDIHPQSVKAVPGIIKMLKEEGYTFVTVDQLLAGKQKPLHQYFGMTDERLVE